MSVTKEEVRNTAKLARLNFNEEEITALQDSMTSIVEMFDNLSEVCTEEVKHLDILPKQKLEKFPKENPSDGQNCTETVASFAIEFDKNSQEFLVPQVIDEE